MAKFKITVEMKEVPDSVAKDAELMFATFAETEFRPAIEYLRKEGHQAVVIVTSRLNDNELKRSTYGEETEAPQKETTDEPTKADGG